MTTIARPTPQRILDLAEEGMRFYERMSGMSPNKETFIRDWVAIGLHRDSGLIVTVETNRTQFREWFASIENEEDFRIDLLAWEPKGDDPDDAELCAIVEFKTNGNPNKIKSDIERTSRLLAAAKRPTRDIFGYQVVCTSYWPGSGSKHLPEIDAENMSKAAQALSSICELNFERRLFQISKPHHYWCGVFCLSILPQAQELESLRSRQGETVWPSQLP